MRLDQVCEIQSGFTARGKLEESPSGIPVLQLRDLNETTGWDSIIPCRFELDEVHARYFAGPGDVLFRSRGTNNTATAIPEDWQHLAAVVLPLILLKPNDIIRPAFLEWSINAPGAQRKLEKSIQGTALRMVPRNALAELQIDVPALATQDAILEAARLAARARELETNAANLRHALSDLILHDAAKRAATPNPKKAHA
ncbi:MAG: restriction endonuclease subunit S [Hyphomonas sp.]|nr:restriction endonuclease subunit S [Hyphomonas sp.]